MFFARPEPLELTAEVLLALRLSLNTPVVSTAELPVGPARAALAVHREPSGCANVTVAIRSLRSDESVHYSFEGDLGSDSSVAVALDAGLSFAETMGFLFGEDELAEDDPGARKRGFERWGEIAWGGVPPGDAGSAEAQAAPDAEREFLLDQLASSLSEALGNDGPEIMLELEEEVPSELDLDGESATPAPPPAAARDAAPAAPALSKFRAPPAPTSAPVEESAPGDQNDNTQHTLGRLKLVKRRRGRLAAGTEKPNPILRLLSSF